MSIEITITEWLDGQAGLTLETDLFLQNLFQDEREGTCVIYIRDVTSFDCLDHAVISIVIFKRDYVVGRNLQKAIITLLNDYRGSIDGAWAVVDDIDGDNLGLDENNRNRFSITFEVAFKEA